MLKIFLRKRFVCGYMEFDYDGRRYPVYKASFKTIKEATLYLTYLEYKRVLYDRTTKITVEEGLSIKEYFEVLDKIG